MNMLCIDEDRLIKFAVINNNQTTLVNRALTKLKEISPSYSNIVVYNSWVDVREQRVPILWNLLTSDGTGVSNMEYEANNSYVKQNEQCVTTADPTVMDNLNVLRMDPRQIVNIAPTEGQIPVSHTKSSKIVKH